MQTKNICNGTVEFNASRTHESKRRRLGADLNSLLRVFFLFTEVAVTSNLLHDLLSNNSWAVPLVSLNQVFLIWRCVLKFARIGLFTNDNRNNLNNNTKHRFSIRPESSFKLLVDKVETFESVDEILKCDHSNVCY